jgi:two-component sensor histidine kinase
MTSDPINILLVDDQSAKLLSYEAILQGLGENLIKAGSAREALKHLLKTDIAIVLTDVCMPELDGFELAGMIRDHPRFQQTAIIFISAVALTDPDRVKGYSYGGVDYLLVPVVPELLRAKVRAFADLFRKTRQLELVNAQLERRVEERTAELTRANADLSRMVDEKEAALRRAQLMAKEIDHRVMNSLQLVSGLLNMQSRGMGSSEAAEQLALASHRVTAISQVHRHIYQSDGVDKVNCKGYLERLCAELFRTLRSGESDAIVVVSDDVELPTEQIIPLGLIVNELVTNSVKHGASRITVSLIQEATEGYVLTVTDDGAGLPADFDPASTSGFGMKVLSALASQLGGELRFGGASSASGANFSIHVATSINTKVVPFSTRPAAKTCATPCSLLPESAARSIPSASAIG